MNTKMDTLHLFTIPKWLPNTLLPEIWAIIFHWKWRLEMKEILKQLPKKSETKNIGNDDYEPRQKSGNHWLKFRNHPGSCFVGWYYPIDVTEKCGIELLNYKDIPIHKYGMNTFPIFCSAATLHRHLQENLGIKCSRKLDYKSMLKLLRNV